MLDAIATVILAGMMFIPIINLVVGILIGTGQFGVAGGFAGAVLGVLITIAQKQNRDWREFRSARARLGAQIIDFPGGPAAGVL